MPTPAMSAVATTKRACYDICYSTKLVFPHARAKIHWQSLSVSFTVLNLGNEFNGVVLDIPGSLKTLYLDGKRVESVSLREW